MPQQNKMVPLVKELADILGSLEKGPELEMFLHGLLTPSEIEEIINRWHLLCALEEGETHRQISARLGVSLGKIARGSRLIKYGDEKFVNIVRKIKRQKPG
ncbi:MAG: Trp family transcriptional regulator [Lentisphaeria bacterium]|jgi:TrpR family trp operon transcriptional repressor|nr:Trp family transcriptional regulator [Lentisphaeria bacterium]NLZ60027.1 transcriptional regulator [Lentisphaerota bacterium]